MAKSKLFPGEQTEPKGFKVLAILFVIIIAVIIGAFLGKQLKHPPNVNIMGDSPKYINTTHGTLVFTATDNTPDITCHVELNSVITATIQVTSGIQAELPMTLEQGQNDIRVKATDQAGNEAWSGTYIVHVDSEPPEVIIIDFRASQ